jgi:hypothetical protein
MKIRIILKNGVSGALCLGLAGCATTSPLPVSKIRANKPRSYPIHCIPVKPQLFHNGRLTIKNAPHGDAMRLLLLGNVSSKQIIVDRFEKDPGADAGWLTPISPSKWSALNIDTKQFVITCNHEKGGTWDLLACQKVIKACWLPVKTHKKDLLEGGFWVAENVPLSTLYQTIPKHGFTINLEHE